MRIAIRPTMKEPEKAPNQKLLSSRKKGSSVGAEGEGVEQEAVSRRFSLRH